MSCLLPLIASVCLADPSTLTFRADAHVQVSQPNFYTVERQPYNGAIGRLEISMDAQLPANVSMTYFVGHASYAQTTRDRGYEYVGVGFTWRPFR